MQNDKPALKGANVVVRALALTTLLFASNALMGAGFERLTKLPRGASVCTPCFVSDMDHDSLMEFGMWCADEFDWMGWEIWKCIPPDTFVLVKEAENVYPPSDPTQPGNLIPWDAGDVDGDNKTEIVGVNFGEDGLYVQTVESDDYYSLPSIINWDSKYTTYAYMSTPFQLADLDNDSKKDILFLMGQAVVLVYENVRNDSSRLVWSDTTALYLYNFVWGDFDCDGLTDFTSGDIDSRFIVWEHTGADNQYHRVYTGDVEDEEGTAYDAFGGKDMDGDGKPDFFFSVSWGLGTPWYELWHYYATGNNQYAGELVGSSDWGEVGWASSDIGDVDGDSLLEIAWSLGSRIWLLDDAAHGYEQLGEWVGDHYGNSDQLLVTCADLDLDGSDEVLVTGCFRTSVLKWKDTVAVAENPPEQPSLDLRVTSSIGQTCTIRYTLPQSARINLTIYDASGRRVETLKQGQESQGTYAITWDASRLPSGVYFVRITVPKGGRTCKTVVLR